MKKINKLKRYLINCLIDINGDEWIEEVEYLGANKWKYYYYGSCEMYGEVDEEKKLDSYELFRLLDSKDDEDREKRLKSFYEYLNTEIVDSERNDIIFNILSNECKPIKPACYILSEKDLELMNSYFNIEELLTIDVGTLYKKISELFLKTVDRKRYPGGGSYPTGGNEQLKALRNKLGILVKFDSLMVE